MRRESRSARALGLHAPPLPSYNRPAAGVPVRLSSAPGHVRGPAPGGPMLLNSRGPILLKTDTVDTGGTPSPVRCRVRRVTPSLDAMPARWNPHSRPRA
jgi:hypothetical protein